MKKIIISVLIVLMFLTMPLNAMVPKENIQSNPQSTTDIGQSAEFLDVFLGKRNAVLITYSSVGGQLSLPLNFTWSEFENLVALKVSIGVGYRWWLWYHRDIWPDIPPGLALTVVYKEGAETAVPKAKSLADKISDIYGIELQPVVRETLGAYTIVRFFRALSTGDALSFTESNILPMINEDGLGVIKNSPKIQDDINNEKYFRGFYALIRDVNDIDLDNITMEYIPVTGLAFVSNGTILRVENRTFELSLDRALGQDNVYDKSETKNASIVRVHFLLPVEVVEENSTMPDNPLYEYSGVLAYNLKRGNFTRDDLPLDDIKITFKPFSAQEELKTMPRVFSRFYISKVNTTYELDGSNATKIDFTLNITNRGGSSALDLKAYFFMPKSLLYLLFKLKRMGYNISEILVSNDWVIHWNASYRTYKGIILTSSLGDLAVNGTTAITFSIIVPNNLTYALKYIPIAITFGPMVYFKDIEGKFYISIANGMFIWATRTSVGARLTIDKTELYTDKTLTITANITVFNFGPSDDIKNVEVNLVRGIMTEMDEFMDFKIIASSTISRIGAKDSKSLLLQSNQALRPGFWTILGYIKFEIGNKKFMVSTNGAGILVLPPKNLYDKWVRKLRYPIPHVELDIFKNVTKDGDTLNVEIYIRNTGELDTTLNIIDWWSLDIVDTSKGVNGVLYFSVNGSTLDFDVSIDNLLGVIRVKSLSTTVKVNQTIVISFQLALKSGVNASDIVPNPTLVRYLYGTIPPENIERPDQGGSTGTNITQLFTTSFESKAYNVYLKSIEPMGDGTSTYLDTYTNAVLEISEIIGGGGGGAPYRIPRFAVIGIIAIIIVATVALFLTRKRS